MFDHMFDFLTNLLLSGHERKLDETYAQLEANLAKARTAVEEAVKSQQMLEERIATRRAFGEDVTELESKLKEHKEKTAALQIRLRDLEDAAKKAFRKKESLKNKKKTDNWN